MNRWWGSKEDSDKQTSERSQRAARRTIRDLTLVLSDDDEFEDCNTSIQNRSLFNLDGQVDSESSEEDTPDNPIMDADAIAAQRALPVQDSSFPDDAEAWKKEIKLKFNNQDVKYWFNSVESSMKKYGINTQWSKKDAIVHLLPDEIVEECMPILRLTQDEAGEYVYRDLKNEIIKLYGPKEEDAYLEALNYTLTGKPSALGKKILHKICPGAKPLEGCHCAKVVYGMWVQKMSPAIKASISSYKFSHSTYNEVFDVADKTWLAHGGATKPAVVAAVAAEATPSSASTPEAPQVAAVANRGRGGRGNFRGGRGGRGGRGTYRGGQNQNNNSNQRQTQNTGTNYVQKPHQKGPRHADGPPDSSCSRHWSQGRGATYCSDPLVCGWSHIIAPRPKNQNNTN